MKSTSVAIGCLTGLASASYNHPRHFHHVPRHYAVNNMTASTTSSVDAATSSVDAEGGKGPQTTLTVAVTNLHTVISCAPTVTNCPGANNTAALSTMPASDVMTSVVTEIVDLATTVCPVTEAESVSKSVVEAHSSGYVVGTTRPAPGGPVPTVSATATAPGAVETGKPATSVSATVGTTDKVLTMTVGPSGSQTVVTTTIRSTFTEMVTVTMSAPGTKETSENSPNKGGNQGGNQPSYPVNTPPAPVNEGTTTTTSTSTGTRTVTVGRSSTATETGSLPTGEASTPGGTTNPDSGKGNSNGNGDCECPAPATVTVTAPAQTVYVTAPAAAATQSASSPAGDNSGSGSGSYPVADKPKSGSDNSAVGSDKPATGSDKPATGSEQPTPAKDTPAGEGADGAEEDECPPEDEPVIATKVQTVVPYPTGSTNGTQPNGAAAPTGYPTRGYAKLR